MMWGFPAQGEPRPGHATPLVVVPSLSSRSEHSSWAKPEASSGICQALKARQAQKHHIAIPFHSCKALSATPSAGSRPGMMWQEKKVPEAHKVRSLGPASQPIWAKEEAWRAKEARRRLTQGRISCGKQHRAVSTKQQ